MADFDEIAQAIADGGEVALPLVIEKNTPLEPSGNTLRYSPEVMIGLIIANPDWNHAKLAAAFGRKASWMAAVVASEVFQTALEGRREQILDPMIVATVEERFKALTIQSLSVLSEKLDLGKALQDATVLKAVEIGVKALGMGLKPTESSLPAEMNPMTASERVANKIMQAMEKQDRQRSEAVDVVMTEVPSSGK